MRSKKKLDVRGKFEEIVRENFNFSEEKISYYSENFLKFYKEYITFNSFCERRTLSERYVLHFKYVVKNYKPDIILYSIKDVMSSIDSGKNDVVSPGYFEEILKSKSKKKFGS